MNATSTLLPAVTPAAVEGRAWLSSDGCAGAVLDLLDGLGWNVVHAPDGNVYCTSPDTRVYVAWLPEDRTAWKRGVIWQIQVRATDGDPWVQEFSSTTPSECVAAFLAALIAHAAL